MVQDEDLEAAVAEGIITQAQVDRLRAFALRRLPQSAAERVDEERFRFLIGFNDFFFAVGVALVGIALSLFAGSTVIANVLSALLIWLLSESWFGACVLLCRASCSLVFSCSLSSERRKWIGIGLHNLRT